MAVNLKCSDKSHGIRKYSFCQNQLRSDGLHVQIHHKILGNGNPVRFLQGVFHNSEDLLAVADARGNIFIIDLAHNKFWSLPNDNQCTAIAFSSFRRNDIIVASSEGFIKVINFENGKECGCLKGHKMPPTHLSSGGDGGKMLLSSSCSSQYRQKYKASSESELEATGEAILWDLSTHTQAHCLNVNSDSGLKQATFLPGVSSDYILAMFEDDTMYVWKFGSFKCVKLIQPPSSKKEHHHMKTIACTRNGRAMIVGGKSHSLVAYSLDTWEAVKVIELPDEVCGVMRLEFLPQPFDGGSNNVLAMLSHDGHIYFMDFNSSTFIGSIRPERNLIYNFTCSSSGCYVACILKSGEVNIYYGSLVLDSKMPIKQKVAADNVTQKLMTTKGKPAYHENHSSPIEREKICQGATSKRNPSVLKKNSTRIDEQIKSELNHKRLRSLLRHCGEFPSRYRIVAWRTALLQLPYNHKAFRGLMSRGIHPAYSHMEKKYPLENQCELKYLKKVMSCLAHWTPLFSQVDYLPLFIYPFIKLFIHDILGCFEAVVTIIINYCQHWFEFFPFPPINVLASIENLLSHHDPSLLGFFVKSGINTRVYAWPLLQVAFSEVLSNEEWIRFWDHVLVNEPSFLLAAVPAYCIVCRTALLRCRNMDDFQFFFRNQNPVDMEKFISKTYWICQNTPPEYHPRQHLQEFQPLPKGETYPVFSQYPKILVDENAEKLKKIQLDEEAVISQELEMLKLLQQREKEKKVAENALLKQKYLKELEKAYQYALKLEEDKVSRRYMELLNLKRNFVVTNIAGKIDTLGKEDMENSPISKEGHPISSQKQKRNKKNADNPSSAKSFPELHKERPSYHSSGKWPPENEGQYLRKQLHELDSIEGSEAWCSSTVNNNDREEISFDVAEQCETSGEYNGLVGNKCKILLHKFKAKEVHSATSIPMTDSLESPEITKVQDIDFSKNNEKKRWEIIQEPSRDHLWRHLVVDGVSSQRYEDIYSKEQEAVKQAMDARIKVVHGRMISSAF